MKTKKEILDAWKNLPFIKIDYSEDLDKNKKYKVVSTVDNPLTLSTDYSESPNRIEYRFEQIGDCIEISLEHITDILSMQIRFSENVFFCIMDKGMVDRFGLSEFYYDVIDNLQ